MERVVEKFVICNSNFVHFLEATRSKIFFYTLFFVFYFIYLGGGGGGGNG